MRRYLFGYPKDGVETRLTLAELETKWTWSMLHPEFRRRLIAMLDDCQDAGHDCGIGEGARKTSVQRATFLHRHLVVQSGGCCSFEGKRYRLRPGMAHAAPPGASVHEDELYEGYALAADIRGWENHWCDANCHRYGLKNFGGKIGPNVNNEEWHYQPVEFTNSRSGIRMQIASGIKLARYPLPDSGEPLPPPAPLPPIPVVPPVVEPPLPPPVILPEPPKEEEDQMIVLVITDVRPPHARWKSNGVVKTWVTGDMSAQIDLRLAESQGGTKPSPVDGFIYKELVHGSNDVIASYGPIVGAHPGAPFDGHGRIL